MTINGELLKRLQAEAAELNVVVALPSYAPRVDPRSQACILSAAEYELWVLRYERGDHDV